MKIKTTLLLSILENPSTPQKYSQAFMNMKNIVELELISKESIPQSIKEEYDELKQLYEDFRDGIPLIVIERYYVQHVNELNKMVFLTYRGNELTDITVIDLFYELELFYQRLYTLACTIANFYSIEFKLNKESMEEMENNNTFV